MIRRRLVSLGRRGLMWLGARGRVGARQAMGRPASGAVPVIMCLWNRPDRLDAILDQLAAQRLDRPIRLMLWNNQRRNRAQYAEVLRRRAPSGALGSVELTTSPFNVGGIARFYVMARLRRLGVRGPVVLLDDDQDVSQAFVAELLAAYTPTSVHGVWAWRTGAGYWDRTPASGSDATYVGTGGSVLDLDIVDDRRFFTALPQRYLFLEDIWMSAVARRRGWTLSSVDADYSFVLEEVGQHHALAAAKDEFFIYLHSPESDRAWESARR